MLIRKCDNCKKEIKKREEEATAGCGGWPQVFVLREVREVDHLVSQEAKTSRIRRERETHLREKLGVSLD